MSRSGHLRGVLARRGAAAGLGMLIVAALPFASAHAGGPPAAAAAKGSATSGGRIVELSIAPVAATSKAELALELLQPRVAQAAGYAAAGVDLVTLEVGWDAAEPTRGSLNTDYLARSKADAATYRAAGLGVVLDLGLQYPPAWGWTLPGPTRFTNQYGQEWVGTVGTDPLNAVWNSVAREAEAAYVRSLAASLAGEDFASIRIGGLMSGEIRLPPSAFGGHTDSLWGFDANAAAASPVAGWRPMTGTADDAARWLDFYLGSVANYQQWLAGVVGEAFPGTPIDVLMPGWGLRPGDVEKSAAALLSSASIMAAGDSLSAGLDWERQVSALAGSGLDVTLVTTWLDAPSYGESSRDQPPVAYLGGLADRVGLPVSGESTGGGGTASLDRIVSQGARFGLARATWMSGSDLDTSAGVSLAELGSAFGGAGG